MDIDRGKIRLGIEAPKDVKVYREEIAPAGWPTLADIGRQLAESKTA